MSDTNITTTIKDFIILGFPALEPDYYGVVSALFFFVYLVIVLGNLFVLIIVTLERCLHKPTYVIFCNMALTDLLFGTVTLPKIISRYWWDDKITSFNACFTQMYFVHALGAIQSFILLIMALDRLIAICFPLQYPLVISNSRVSLACGVFWAGTFIRMGAVVYHALTLPYCGPNVIVQCYCDHISITRLACGPDVQFVIEVAVALAMFTLLVPVIIIIISFFPILVVVMRISDSCGRYKTLSTCTPQIFLTCLYYLPRCFVYVANSLGYNFSLDIRIVVIFLYSLIPAAINPMVYCFKTKDIKDIVIKIFRKTKIGM